MPVTAPHRSPAAGVVRSNTHPATPVSSWTLCPHVHIRPSPKPTLTCSRQHPRLVVLVFANDSTLAPTSALILGAIGAAVSSPSAPGVWHHVYALASPLGGSGGATGFFSYFRSNGVGLDGSRRRSNILTFPSVPMDTNHALESHPGQNAGGSGGSPGSSPSAGGTGSGAGGCGGGNEGCSPSHFMSTTH